MFRASFRLARLFADRVTVILSKCKRYKLRNYAPPSFEELRNT